MVRRNVEVAVTAGATLAEGPTWRRDERELQWVDVFAGTISRWRLDEPGARSSLPVDDMLTTALPATRGFTVASSRDAILILDGSLTTPATVLTQLELSKELRFNDGAIAPDGSLLVGTMSVSGLTRSGSLYRISPDGLVSVVFEAVTTSNGIGWTEDPNKFYYVDSGPRRLDLVHWATDCHELPLRRPVCTLETGVVPDGLAVDEESFAWVACWDAGVVRCYSPTGRLVEQLDLPVTRPTSCVFGGDRLDTLFITTARYGLSDLELVRQPLAGHILAVDVGRCGLNVRGSEFQLQPERR